MLHECTAAKWSASYIHNHVVDPRCRSGRRQRSLSNIDSFQRLHGRVQLWMSASLFLFPFVCPQTHSKLHVQDCTTELPVTPCSELHFCPLTHPHLCLVLVSKLSKYGMLQTKQLGSEKTHNGTSPVNIRKCCTKC